MAVNHAFLINYNNFEFILPKSSVKFQNGYGLAQATYVDYGTYLPLWGIVNENFKVILDLTDISLIPKINFLPDNKAIAIMYDGFSYSVNLCSLTDKLNIVYQTNAVNYKLITENECLLGYQDNGEYSFILFDISTGRFLSSSCHSFTEFQYDQNVGDFVSWFTLEIDQDRILSWCVTAKGKVISPYIDVLTKRTYDSSKSLNEIINLVTEEHKRK